MPINFKPGAKEARPFAVYIAGRLARSGRHSTAPHPNGCCFVSGLYSGRLPDGCGRCRWEICPLKIQAALKAQAKYRIARARVRSANESLSGTIVDSKSCLWTIPPIGDAAPHVVLDACCTVPNSPQSRGKHSHREHVPQHSPMLSVSTHIHANVILLADCMWHLSFSTPLSFSFLPLSLRDCPTSPPQVSHIYPNLAFSSSASHCSGSTTPLRTVTTNICFFFKA